MSKRVKEKTPPISVQKGSRFEGLSGTRLQREIQKQIEEKREAREKRRKEARGTEVVIERRMPPVELTSGPLKRKTFHAPMGQG